MVSSGRAARLLLLRELPDLVCVAPWLGRLLDHAELERDVGGSLERFRIHLSERARRSRWAPNQLVDLSHHPSLMLAPEHRALLEHDLDALGGLVATELPSLQRRAQETGGDLLVL